MHGRHHHFRHLLRMPDAPVLSIRIDGPTTLSVKDRSHGDFTIPSKSQSYMTQLLAQRMTGDRSHFIRPCSKLWTFHYNGFRLYVKKHDEWSEHEVNGEIQHHAFSSSPSPVNVGKNEDRFQSLIPGESCSFSRKVTDFPKNFAPGDRFRYGYKGDKLDWWDWGNLYDHENTVVMAGSVWFMIQEIMEGDL